MSQTKGKIIDHFYGGIIRDEKTRIDGAALNVEELDIFENANFVRAAQVMTRVATSSSSPSSSPSASDVSASPTNSPSASPSSSPSASSFPGIVNGLVAYWELEEASGTRVDSHASYDLTPVNTPNSATGIRGSGVDFEGSANQYLSLADASSGELKFGDSDYTFSLWYKPETTDINSRILLSRMGSSTAREYQIYMSGSAYKFGIAVFNGTSTTIGEATHPTAASVGNWYHIVGYHSATSNEVGISVNGSAFTTASTTGAAGTATTEFRLGSRVESDPLYADGVLDEVGAWNRVLTLDEVTALYNSGNGVTYDDIIAGIGSASSSPSTSASGSPYVDMSYVGGKTGGSTSGAEVTIDLTALTGGSDTSPSEGDIVVLAFHYWTESVGDSDVSPTTSGYTEIADLLSNDTYDGQMYVGYKVMGVSPDASVVIPANTQSGRSSTAVVQVWRGVDTSTPMDTTATTATGTNGNTADPASITPVTSGAVVIAIGGASTGGQKFTATSSGYSNSLIVHADGGDVSTLGMCSKAWTTGAENPGAFSVTGNESSASWTAVTMALRPAAGDNSPSSSPSSSVSSSPSASVFPQDQTEITAYTGDLNDNAWGYGGQATTNAVQIYKLTNAGSDTPGSFELVNISGDIVNEAFAQSPLQYHKTDEANAIYYLKKAGTDISLVRYDIDNDTEDVWTGSAWGAVPSSSPSPSVASPSPSAGESGDIPLTSQLTGLTGTNDRYFMRVEFGELYIGNGNYIAKVDSEGTFTEKAFQLPLEWEAVDITFVSDVGLILARNINRKANYSKAFWWDLTSEVQFDNQITIPHGGPQWIVNFKERLYVLCSQNGVATFYSSVASPGVPLQKVPGMELANLAAETATQEISSPKMMAIKDGILYFGLYKTDKSGIYAIGSLDEDKPTALILAKRFDTTDYSRHIPIALHTQGPNFYASYEDNGAFKHARCESNNSPDRSSNAVYESVIFDEGDPTKNKDIMGVYVMTKPLAAGTNVTAYVKADYGSWTQVLQEDGITYSTATKLLGNFRGKSITGKTHQFKFQLASNGSDSPIVTGLAYVARVSDLPAYA